MSKLLTGSLLKSTLQWVYSPAFGPVLFFGTNRLSLEEDRERMARIVKRHQKPVKKEIRPEDEASATIVSDTPEHN